MRLDNFDIKLLNLLQGNSKLSQRELSEAVNLSASAVNRRIAALEAAGVTLTSQGLAMILRPSGGRSRCWWR